MRRVRCFESCCALSLALGAVSCLVPNTQPGGSAVGVARPDYQAPSSRASGNYGWRSVPMQGGGFVTGVVMSTASRGLAYARTDVGGAYRWDPAGKRWQPITDHLGRKDNNLLGVESIALDPTDPDKLYLALGMYSQSWAPTGAMLRSSDRGKTYQRTDLPIKLGGNENARANGERLAVDPNQPSTLLFGSRRNGLWKSSDGSKSWAQLKSFPVPEDASKEGHGIVFVVFDAKGSPPKQESKLIYAGVASSKAGLWRSTDAGASFAPVPGQPTGVMPGHASFDAAGNLYLAYGNVPGPSDMTDGAVWKLDTKTGGWTNVTPLPPGKTPKDRFGYGGLSVSASQPGTLMVTTIDRWTEGDEIFRSTDGGKSWKALAATAQRDIKGARYLHWGRDEPSSVGWMGDIDIDPFDPAQAFYVTGQGVWRSGDVNASEQDKPTHWVFENDNLEECVVTDLLSPPAGPPLLSGVGDLGGFRHDDLSKPPERGMFDRPIHGWVSNLDFAELKPELVARVGRSDNGERRGALSKDAGATWQPFAAEPAESQGFGSVALAADGSSLLWSPRGAPAAVSFDQGASWQAVKGLPPPARVPDWAPHHLKLAADRANPKKLYALELLSAVFYVSQDGGRSFRSSMVGLPSLPDYQLTSGSLRAVPGFDGELWITAGKGLFHSSDSGYTFSRIAPLEAAHSVGFGKAAPGSNYPAVYVIGAIEGQDGFFRSDDRGESWVRINDDQHQYGGGSVIIGDPRVYGRAYVGTSGRGVVVGEPH